MEINFIGGAYETFSKNINPQECVNFFPVTDKTGGKSLSLRGTPGLKEWLNLSNVSEIRNVIEYSRWSYWVCGDRVYQVDTDGTSVTCSGTLNTSEDFAWMALNNAGEIMIVDGSAGYIVSGTTLTQITDTDFPSRPTSVAFQDGYFIITFEESGRIQIDALNDGTSWDSTDYGNAEARPDDSLALISDRDELIVLGGETKQSFRNTGATFPFTKISGSTQSIGINAPSSLKQFTNTFFWLSDKLQFVQAEGYGAKPISPPPIDYQIGQMTTTNDCVSFGYIQEGNAFLVNQFKTANQTWVYDVSTGFWHRRTSYPDNGRWRANCYIYFAGKHLVGDHSNGKIYELDYETFTDDGEEIKRKRIPPTISSEGKEVFHHSLEIFFEPGVGTSNQYLYPLKFDGKSGDFRIGSKVYGYTSSAYGTVVKVTRNGTSGILWLKDISGTFSNNEIIYEASYGAELVTNGDMEIDDNWVNYGTPTTNERSSEQKHAGTYSRKFVGNGIADGLSSDAIAVTANHFYIYDGYLYISAITATAVSTYITRTDTYAVDSPITTTTTTGSFQQCTGVFQADTAEVKFVSIQSGAGAVTAYLDDASLKKITNAALVNGTIGAVIDDPSYNPQAMLRYSNNNGNVWSNEIWRSVGKIGEYDVRGVWNRLGSGRNRNYELTVSAPVKWVIVSANLEATQGTS